MEVSFVKPVNFVDSAARNELKVVQTAVTTPSGILQDIYNEVLLASHGSYQASSVSVIGSNKIEIKFPNDYPESLENVVKYYRANLKSDQFKESSGIRNNRAFHKLSSTNGKSEVVFKKCGVGEKRIYIGNYSSRNKELNPFLELDKPFVVMRKRDLQNYLRDAQAEFFFPSQKYYYPHKLQSCYQEAVELLGSMPEQLSGTIKEIQPDTQNRVYLVAASRRLNPLLLLSKFCLPHLTTVVFVIRGNKIFCKPVFTSTHEQKPLPKEFVSSDLYRHRNRIQDASDLSYLSATDSLGNCGPRGQEQAVFREQVLDANDRCVISSCGILAILEAAHIKPYVVCCEQGQREEMFDPKNGLTLRADLHKLFDAKLISFGIDRGRVVLLISEEVSPQERKKLAIEEGQFIHIDALEHEHYLQYHREHIFRP